MHRITTCESPRTAASSPTAFARSGSGTATVRGADRPRPRYTACDPVTVIVCAEWGGCETGLVSPLGAFNVLELHLSPSSHARDGGTQRRAQASHARWIRPNENTLQVADQVIARSAAGGGVVWGLRLIGDHFGRRRPSPRALSSDGATHGSLKREADEKGPKKLPGHLIATSGRGRRRRRRRHSAIAGCTRIASAARLDGLQRDATRAGVADVAMAPLGPADGIVLRVSRAEDVPASLCLAVAPPCRAASSPDCSAFGNVPGRDASQRHLHANNGRLVSATATVTRAPRHASAPGPTRTPVAQGGLPSHGQLSSRRRLLVTEGIATWCAAPSRLSASAANGGGRTSDRAHAGWLLV